MRKTGLECLHGVDNKLPLLENWLQKRNLELSKTIYIGNDINDLECLSASGCGVAPADAHPDVLPTANLILNNAGGYGAVRELCDLVCKKPETNNRLSHDRAARLWLGQQHRN